MRVVVVILICCFGANLTAQLAVGLRRGLVGFQSDVRRRALYYGVGLLPQVRGGVESSFSLRPTLSLGYAQRVGDRL